MKNFRYIAAIILAVSSLFAMAGSSMAFAAVAPQSGGVVLDGYGGLHAFGGFSLDEKGAPYWRGFDIARSLDVLPDGDGGWVLDGYGGIHAFGSAPVLVDSAYWPGIDIAKALYVFPNETSGYVMDGYGGIHPFGGAPPLPSLPYWNGQDVARGLSVHLGADGVPNGAAILDAWGGVHVAGVFPGVVNVPVYYPGKNIYLGLHATEQGAVYAVEQYGMVVSLTGSAYSPSWAGFPGWKGWNIITDVVTPSSVGSGGGQGISAASMIGLWGMEETTSYTFPHLSMDMPLDCESVALSVATAIEGHYRSQNWIFNALPKQPGSAELNAAGHVVRWGDPYVGFVGNSFGSETGTGYGVYAGPVAAIASEIPGLRGQAFYGATMQELAQEMGEGKAIVVWGDYLWKPVATQYYEAWDGRTIPWSQWDHTIPVVAINGYRHTITIWDTGWDREHIFTWVQWQAIWNVLGDQMVVVSR